MNSLFRAQGISAMYMCTALYVKDRNSMKNNSTKPQTGSLTWRCGAQSLQPI